MYVTDVDSSALFGDKYIALFVMNDVLSNNSVKVAVRLDTSLFCSPVLGLGVEKEKVRLYPNPTSGKVILPEGFENASYEIALINGKLLIRGNTVFGNIDLSKLLPGIYFIKAAQKQSGKQYWFRVLKEN